MAAAPGLGDALRPRPPSLFLFSGGHARALRVGADVEATHRRLAPYREAAACGPWARSQLFVSHAGATSPLHFDQYANFFVQRRGRKRVRLAPPEFARVAAPYPAHAGLDTYAANPGAAGPALVSTVLGPGDVLFIPPFWWHAIDTLDDDCVSVNYWFGTEATLLKKPVPPLAPFREHEVARLVQYLVHDAAGPGAVGPFLAGLRAELAGKSPAADAPPHLAIQNYVVHQLACLVGPRGLADFAATYFPLS